MTNIPDGFELKEKVAQLSQALLSKHPQMPVLLREIHKTLSTYPENITLLSEEEIQQIVSGLKVQTQTEFASTVVKSAGKVGVTSNIKKNAASALGLD